MKKLAFAAALAFCVLLFTQFKMDNSPMKVLPKDVRADLAWIPGGNAILGKDTSRVEAFYMSKTEISQAEYDAFLGALRTSGEFEELQIASVDSMQWTSIGNYMTSFITHYHAHPAYRNYPIVNISRRGAELYCQWYAGELQKQMGDAYDIEVSLPTRKEWIRAARGDQHFFKYAWGGPALRNAKGCALCNFRNLGDESITLNPVTQQYEVKRGEGIMGVAGHLSDNADILAPVNAYSPNEFGMYNMNGNAREMIQEEGKAVGGSWRDPGYDVRNESISEYTGAAPDLGFRPIIRLKKKE